MQRPPTILAFDTTAGACSAAVLRGGTVAAAEYERMTRGHAEALMPMIGRVMAEAGLSYNDLDAVGVTVGPGAFTGIRIGLAAARGIGLAAGIPVIGVSTLHALAPVAGGDVLAVMDTKRNDFYAQRFRDGAPEGEPAVVDAEALVRMAADGGTVTILGDAAVAAATILDEAGCAVAGVESAAAPRAERVAEIAAARFAKGGDFPPPEPLYLRPPMAKLPKNGGALRK